MLRAFAQVSCSATYTVPAPGSRNLPSFSATKFSELLDELPFASFCSTLITSFFVGLRFRQTLPVGPSIGVVAFFNVLRREINKLNL